MKHRFLILVSLLLVGFSLLTHAAESTTGDGNRYDYSNILDVHYTPDTLHKCHGWFTDAGSWMGFTMPEKNKWVNGFCGPFSLDMFRREWVAQSAVVVSYAKHTEEAFTPDSTCYFPGELYMSATSRSGRITQQMNFISSSTALIRINTNVLKDLQFTATEWSRDVAVSVSKQTVTARHKSGETVILTFPSTVKLKAIGNNYVAVMKRPHGTINIAVSFYFNDADISEGTVASKALIEAPTEALAANTNRWNGYIGRILRKDMPSEYDRIAVKAVTTLISNWFCKRGGLLHDGIAPSHAAGYFVGFWAWDTWRFCGATAKFAPELAKSSIRAMFDYQQEDGMVIDCIYTDPKENNARDSKPPLVSWAVDEIYSHTNDRAFLAEMYPKLLKYYKWWFQKRDHNRNGMCEFGATDGTLEAAAWESGMDNAIRFDGAKMLKNEGYDDAWSLDQESVDLNAYLAFECKYLRKFANILGVEFDGPDYSTQVADYFFDKKINFFCDRRLADGSFIEEPGCEAYTVLWTKTATQAQVDSMMPLLRNPKKFSTYIPFPTIAADNPKYDPHGYWRGPIWLDQTYMAIRGLRNYGYHELADQYTLQVFDRLQGLKRGAPIHENYGTHTGERLKASNFSWSSSQLIMMYDDYKR